MREKREIELFVSHEVLTSIELRGHWHEWGGPIVVDPAPLLWGISWVNIGPIAAVGPAIMSSTPVSLSDVGLDDAVMDNTIDAYERCVSCPSQVP